MHYNELKEFMDSVKLLDRTYDIVRIIDPLHKKVLNLKKNNLTELPINCFDFWNNKKVCENCVSMRAFNENTSYIKIEYNKDKIYLLTAIPYEFNNRNVVIELMKDATESMLFEEVGSGGEGSSEVHGLINNMNRLAVRDELTGAYNRRYIKERLPVDMVTSSLSKQSLSIIKTDIDFFRNINDVYGSLTGDCLLKKSAEILSDCLKRTTDWVARYEGEAFLICLPGADLDRALEIAEIMRKEISDKEFLCCGNRLSVTASFGVYSSQALEGCSHVDIVACADKKLFEAKQEGRNCVRG